MTEHLTFHAPLELETYQEDVHNLAQGAHALSTLLRIDEAGKSNAYEMEYPGQVITVSTPPSTQFIVAVCLTAEQFIQFQEIEAAARLARHRLIQNTLGEYNDHFDGGFTFEALKGVRYNLKD